MPLAPLVVNKIQHPKTNDQNQNCFSGHLSAFHCFDIKENGDSGKQITYLKLDVEGTEIGCMKKWLQSGVMKYVQQLGNCLSNYRILAIIRHSRIEDALE